MFKTIIDLCNLASNIKLEQINGLFNNDKSLTVNSLNTVLSLHNGSVLVGMTKSKYLDCFDVFDMELMNEDECERILDHHLLNN